MLKETKRQHFTLAGSTLLVACVAGLLVFFLASGKGSSQNISRERSSQQDSEQVKKDILGKIKSDTNISVAVQNSTEVPFLIQEATVREISGSDFAILSGETPRHFRYSTFPEVTLYNEAAKKVKAFGIAVQSSVDKPGSGRILLKNNLSISPYSTYKVISTEWPKAEPISVEKDGKFVSRLQQPGLDSVKSWLLGSASNLTVTIGYVEFEDGTKWIIPRDMK